MCCVMSSTNGCGGGYVCRTPERIFLMISILILASCGGGEDSAQYQRLLEQANAKEVEARSLGVDTPCQQTSQCGLLTFLEPAACLVSTYKSIPLFHRPRRQPGSPPTNSLCWPSKPSHCVHKPLFPARCWLLCRRHQSVSPINVKPPPLPSHERSELPRSLVAEQVACRRHAPAVCVVAVQGAQVSV